MAEDAIREKRVYDPTRDSAISQRKLTRRDALRVAAGVAIGGIIGERLTRPEPEPTLKDLPKAVYKGITEITPKDLNFRTDHTTESTNIPSDRIIEIYGVNVKGRSRFTIENTLILDGQNADTLAGKGGDWIALKAKYQNALGLVIYDYLYVSRSIQTEKIVKPNYGVGKDLDISHVKDGQYILKDGTPFQGKIGIVKLPETPR